MFILLLSRLGWGVAWMTAVAILLLFLLSGGSHGNISDTGLLAAGLIATIAANGMVLTAPGGALRPAAVIALLAGTAISIATLTVSLLFAVPGIVAMAAFFRETRRRSASAATACR